jgi:DNA repair protein RadC
MEATSSVLFTDFSARDDLAVLLLFTIEKIEEQTKMEKNKATKYIPTQKKKEFQPPMAERVDLGFMDITLVFQKDAGQGFFLCRKLHKQGIVKTKNSPYPYPMQAQNYAIKEWAKTDRPREKLLRKTPESLTDSELLAILIGQGTREKNAVDLAKELLHSVKNNLNELGRLEVHDLIRLKGLGPVKAVTILAALELGRRRHSTGALDKPVVKDSKQVAGYLRVMLQDQPREVFAVIFLNQANRVNHFEVVSLGGITGTVADPRVILKKALETHAVNLILCHNHPSGNLKPSKSDEELTYKIRDAARFFDIKVIDHIIVSHEGYFSFADEGLM